MPGLNPLLSQAQELLPLVALFNNLAINATGTYALEGTTTVNGNLNIQAGSLTAPSGDLDVLG